MVQTCSRLYSSSWTSTITSRNLHFRTWEWQTEIDITDHISLEAGVKSPHFCISKSEKSFYIIRSFHKIILLLMLQFLVVVAGQTSFIGPKVIGIYWLAGVMRMHDVSWPSIIPSYHSGCNVQPYWPWISHKKVKNIRCIKG